MPAPQRTGRAAPGDAPAPAAPAVQVGILGPLILRVGGSVVDAAAPKLRALAIDLVVHADEVVSTDRLINDLWGDHPPTTALGTLRTYIARLRALLDEDGATAVATVPPGYCLRLDAGSIDAQRFALLRDDARSLIPIDPPEAARRLRAALELWRGPALVDVAYEDWAQPAIARLEELRWSAREELAEIELAQGHHAEIVAELEAHVAAEPFRERLRGQLMIALYRCGRQAAALRVYQQFRRLMAEELGVDPSAELRHLEQSILLQRRDLEWRPGVGGRPAGGTGTKRPSTSFVGRAAEMAHVQELLLANRIVTLIGTGGCGKTRLASELAAELAASYADGVTVVELAALDDGTHVPRAVADALGLHEEPGQPLVDTLGALLRERELLLVLDNCEHLLEACVALISRLLAAAPALTILATSREPLAMDIETAWLVPPLPAEAAVHLFVDRAAQAQPGFSRTADNAAAIAEIARRLDGIPLALELAAARVRFLSPHEIAAALERRFELLSSGFRTAPSRHRTLRASVDWSYDLLSGDERVLFRRLSVLASSFGVDAARDVAAGDDLPRGQILDLLLRLVDKSLLTTSASVGTTRFRLLETMRQYAWERLSDARDELAATSDRHLEWCVTRAECAGAGFLGPDAGRWLDEIEAERDDMRHALRWALSSSKSAHALRIAVGLGVYWRLRGYRSEGRTWLTNALAAADEAPDGLRSRGLVALSELEYNDGDRTIARRHAEQALASARIDGTPTVLAECLLQAGKVARVQGERELALARYDEALLVARAARSAAAVGSALAGLGDLARERGDTDDARGLYVEALASSRRAGDPHAIGNALLNLGKVACEQGMPHEAAARYEDALATFEPLGDVTCGSEAIAGLAELRRSEAHATHDDGPLRAAEELHARALRQRAGIGQRGAMVDSFEALAQLAAAQHDARRAAKLLGCADALRAATSTTVAPALQDAHARATAQATADLEPVEARAAWQEGREMPLDQAVAYALTGTAPLLGA